MACPRAGSAVILGGNTPVAAAMPATNDNVAAEPARRRAGQRTGGNLASHRPRQDRPAPAPTCRSTSRPAQDLPAQLSIKAKLPSLNGTPTTSFEFQFTVSNQSDKDLLVKLAAKAPHRFPDLVHGGLRHAGAELDPDRGGQGQGPQGQGHAAGQRDRRRLSDRGPGFVRGRRRRHADGDVDHRPAASSSSRGEDDRLNAEAEAGAATPIKLTVAEHRQRAGERLSN